MTALTRHRALTFPGLLLLAVLALWAVSRAQGPTSTVNSTGDGSDLNPGDGICDSDLTTIGSQCTLRAAIEEANNGGAQTIAFGIDGEVVHTINLTSNLPAITVPVVINGYSQSGTSFNTQANSNDAVILIELNGAGIGGGSTALTLTNNVGSTLRGLAINRFSSSGISINGGSNNVVEGCFIGTNTSGTAAGGGNGTGIVITNSSSNTIGGTTAAAHNIIAGNLLNGVAISAGPGFNADNNLVQGNFIGVAADGNTALGNGGAGVHVDTAGATQIGGTTAAARNVISGNNNQITLSTSGTLVQGNYIGTNAAGTAGLGGTGGGISMQGGSNVIGGLTNTPGVAPGNVISGTGASGIETNGNAVPGHTIRGNLIGLNAAGNAPVPNAGRGIWLRNAGGSNTIGGTTATARNVISGNAGSGLDINNSNNQVQGNIIGADAGGTVPVPNNGSGIVITNASSNTIGDTAAGAANFIAHNTGDGVLVSGATSRQNIIRGNRIVANGQLGINLSGGAETNRVTANDANDADTGPNNLQNFPTISSVTATTVTGTLQSTSNTAFVIDFYFNAAADPSGFGEGQTYLDTTNINTDAAGNANFTVTPTGGVPNGGVVTVTATDGSGNTSEFSGVMARAGTLTVTKTADTNDGACDADCSLREAIAAANVASGSTIAFNIPTSDAGFAGGVFTITPASALPALTGDTLVDGSTQAGYVAGGAPKIVLNGINAGANANGLTITNSATIKALTINNFNRGGIISGGAGSGTVTGGAGIYLQGSTGNVIEGCYLGVNADGTAAAANSVGIAISDTANSLIGGNTATARNVISGNLLCGVHLGGANTNNVRVLGNYIGLNAAGAVAIGNQGEGVLVERSAHNSDIGGAGAGAGNLIAGNASGIALSGGNGAVSNIVVQGNSIGLSALGDALSNNGDGILITGAATGNTIGGTAAGAGNTIAFNAANGIQIINAGALGNRIRGNSIHDNARLGINLLGGTEDANGVTPNDALDADAGPNNLQNSPVIAVVTPVAVAGSLQSTPNTSFDFDFYSSAAADPSGFGEGQTYLGAATFTTDAAGNVDFAFNPGGALVTGQFVTATATDAAGNSSEFSAAVRVSPSGLTVTKTADTNDGACDADCSLREAITAANATPNSTISFNIPVADAGFAGGVFTIAPTSALPAITANGTIIDGALQTAFTGNTNAAGPEIVLSGAAAGANASGLRLQASNGAVRNLVINGFSSDGITIDGAFTGNTISGNVIGLNAAGNARVANGGAGVNIINGAQNNAVGGTTAAARNIIAGNNGPGVTIDGAGTNANRIEGNFIGLNVAGAALGNGPFLPGVLITAGAQNNDIGGTTGGARNVISGNAGAGVQITGTGTRGNFVLGNYIGTNAAGGAVLGNARGVTIENGATANTVGGTTAAARNVISGNEYGVLLDGAGTSGNTIAGNYIGTDAAGATALGNRFGVGIVNGATANTVGGSAAARNVISGSDDANIFLSGAASNVVESNFIGTDATGAAALNAALTTTAGVWLNNGSTGNSIGGAGAGEGNVISGQAGAGVLIQGSDSGAAPFSANNVVQGNFIGADSGGTAPLPNGGNGVQITAGANANTIGATTPGAGNLIANNAGDGVLVEDAPTVANTVRGNRIFNNNGLGLNLAGGTEDATGVTVNDAGDADNGANGLQNYPLLTGATGATVTGSLNSTPNTTFTLDFYANTAADPSGFGEGETYLGSATAATDAAGAATFTFTAGAPLPAGQTVSATATDPAGNTSEFSRAPAAGGACVNAPAGAIAWYPAENNANDVVGGHNGATTAGVTYPAARVGTGFQVGGDAVRVPNAAALEPANITVEAWVSATNPGTFKYILAKSLSAGGASYAFYTDGTGGLFFYVKTNVAGNAGAGLGDVWLSPGAGAAIWDGNLHHIAGTFDGAAVRLYVDGAEVGTGTPVNGAIQYANTYQNGDLLIGNFFPTGAPAWPGVIDEMTLYNRALNAGEVQAIFNAGAAGKCGPSASTLSINDVSLTEGDAGTTNAIFTVTLADATAAALGVRATVPVTVDYATADGTATAPGDYTATNGTLTFAPGETTKTIAVPVVGDTAIEPNETFFVNLSNPTNATIADGQGIGTITNDDGVVRPPNDDFVNAQTVGGGAGSLLGFNTNATREAGEPLHGGAQGNTSVWYRWKPPVVGRARFEVSSIGFSSLLGVYTGARVDATATVAGARSQAEGNGFQTAAVEFQADPGTEYFIAVDGANGAQNTFAFRWSLVPGPVPTPTPTQPPSSSEGFSLSGRVTTSSGFGLRGVRVTLSGGEVTLTGITGTDGTYSFTGLPEGRYRVQPAFTGLNFAPPSRTLDVGPGYRKVDFFAYVGAAPAPPPAPEPIVAPVPTPTSTPHETAASPTATPTVAPTIRPTGSPTVPASTPAATAAPTQAPTPASTPPVAARFELSGRVTTNGFGLRGIRMQLTGNGLAREIATGGSGEYAFGDLAPGVYTVTPRYSGLRFSPPSRTLEVGPGYRKVDFFAYLGAMPAPPPAPEPVVAPPPATPAPATPVPTTASTPADTPVAPPAATPTPVATSLPAPASTPTVPLAQQRFAISGRVATSSGFGLRGVTVTLTGGETARAVQTDGQGNFHFADVAPGAYALAPAYPGLAFLPARRTVQVLYSDESEQNFTARVR